MPREIEIDRFKVKSDEGKEYTIIQYQEYIMDRKCADLTTEIEGFKRLTTEEELHVHVIVSNTFKIFEAGEIVRKI